MRLSILLATVLLLGLAATPLSAQVPPDAEWRMFSTEHFRVSYVVGLEPIARRAAERAERAYAVLAEELAEPPRGRIELVLADNVDFANGYATPLPTNRVVIYAHPPVAEANLSFYDDWLQLVVLHELVHVFHLDTAEGVWDRLRTVFGRSPALFPHFFTPGWVIEGLGTYYESRLTRGGRVRGTGFDMALRTAVLEDAFFPIDRATGDPVLWPAGNTRYIYGALFLDFLARTRGPEAVPEFVERYGGQLLPYRVEAAARRAFGTSFAWAWKEWEESLRVRYLALADSLRAVGLTEPELLTEHGRIALFPRYSPDGAMIAYSAASGLDEPSIRVILDDGSIRTAAERTSVGPNAWFPGARGLLFAQLNYVDPYRVYSDLYRVPVGDDDERLTRGARLWEPDLHPDGRRAVVVGNHQGSNLLAVHDLATGETRPLTEPSLDVHWALPRWSPDGGRVAVARWARGGLYDVVVLDSAGIVVREITRDRAVDAAPAWSPDGRHLLFWSDRTGIPNLFAYDLERDALFQVTNVLTGAVQPDVSPDGRWIVFSYYRADGYHIARIPFDPATWRPPPPLRPEVAEPLPPIDYDQAAGGPDRPYSPWPTVLPAAWSLALEGGTELGAGGGVGAFGQDAVERHQWSAELLLYPRDLRAAGGAAYRYRGWGNPVLDLSLFQDWSVLREAEADPDGRPALLRREREVDASLLFLRRRWRSTSWLEAGGEISDRALRYQEPVDIRLPDVPLDLGATLGAGFTSVRRYGLSLGPQEGFTVAGTLEGHRYTRPLQGQDTAGGYLRMTAQGSAFRPLALPGFARHVLALRLRAGAETGSRSPGFSAGGASGGAAPIPVQLEVLGGGLGFPVRGYPQGAQRGNRALTATAEYRFPLLLVDRGFRVLPLFLSRVWGDLFADAGAAWCPGACDNPLLRDPTPEFRPLYSVGAELVADFQLGYAANLPVRLGVGLPLREPYAGSPEFYVRLGRSF